MNYVEQNSTFLPTHKDFVRATMEVCGGSKSEVEKMQEEVAACAVKN